MARPRPEDDRKTALVATEIGMLHQLRQVNEHTTFLPMNPKASCRFMKMITPDLLLRSSARGPRRGDVAADIADAARRAVERMIAIGSARRRRVRRPSTTSSSSAPAWPACRSPSGWLARPRGAGVSGRRRQHAVGPGRARRGHRRTTTRRPRAPTPRRRRRRLRRGRGSRRSSTRDPPRVADLVALGRALRPRRADGGLALTREGGHAPSPRRPRRRRRDAAPR